MSCGLDSPEQISACIYLAKQWFQVMVDIAGLGTFALIAILIWLFRRLRLDLVKWEREAEREKELRKYADSAAQQAEHRAKLAEQSTNQHKKLLVECQDVIRTGNEDLQQTVISLQAALSSSEERQDRALSFTSGGDAAFWSRPVETRFPEYDKAIASSIPIMIFGNQKGGVGKSTVVTNLAAAFAARHERVLTVDMDYQGSHTILARRQLKQNNIEPESLVDYLFQDSLPEDWMQRCIRKIATNLHYVPAFYSFEQIERRLEYRWALGLTTDDVRYRLARSLLSKSAQEKYDRIIIDAPPRFTLGFVNGFCAATHLYIPTVVDGLSTYAVNAFARQFAELRAVVNPHIRLGGIVGCMTFVNTNETLALPGNATPAAEAAELAVQARVGTREPLFIKKPVITRDAVLARETEKGIAYLNDSNVRERFDALADEIALKAPSSKNKGA
jgi:cellulose biosynthesis protein BcsQ